jgi:hypothetical protein
MEQDVVHISEDLRASRTVVRIVLNFEWYNDSLFLE